MPQWINPVVWGAVVGSVVTMILGFGYGGWPNGRLRRAPGAATG
jgi:hypothetical protein